MTNPSSKLPKLWNPDLNDLVRELNQTAASGEAPPSTGPAPAAKVSVEGSLDAPRSLEDSADDPLGGMLAEMTRRGASDLLLIVGLAPVYRINGELVSSSRAPLERREFRELFSAFLTARIDAQLASTGSADFSMRLGSASGARAWRFRVNVHKQRGELAASIRALPPEIPTLAQLNLPASLGELVKATRGLVLVCGPTGSGKSTTLAAMVGEINRTKRFHIVTVEDPIEYEHANDRSVIEQIEVGRDASSFASALRSSLRQNPDVILVGEMRDQETAAIALTAAETGHLVLSTLHTSDTTQAISRIVDLFASNQQSQIYKQLALSLTAVVSQQLIPRVDGRGRVPAAEVLIANYAVRNLIRNERLQALYSEITVGRKQGMVALEDSLASLVNRGLISNEEAQVRARHPEELNNYLRSR